MYKAWDTTLNREVAIQFLAGNLLNHFEAGQRFLRGGVRERVAQTANACRRQDRRFQGLFRPRRECMR